MPYPLVQRRKGGRIHRAYLEGGSKARSRKRQLSGGPETDRRFHLGDGIEPGWPPPLAPKKSRGSLKVHPSSERPSACSPNQIGRQATLALLIEEVDKRRSLLTGADSSEFVGSELPTVDRVLSRIRAEGLARGPVFCEWGSGLGGVCGVAALNGFTPIGIEIRRSLVDAARELSENLDLPMVFAQGTYLLPGDEDSVGQSPLHTDLTFNTRAWDELDLAPADCDVIFAYPWPGEEAIVDKLFLRRAHSDALLLTFHDFDRVLVQRKLGDQLDPQILGWM